MAGDALQHICSPRYVSFFINLFIYTLLTNKMMYDGGIWEGWGGRRAGDMLQCAMYVFFLVNLSFYYIK